MLFTAAQLNDPVLGFPVTSGTAGGTSPAFPNATGYATAEAAFLGSVAKLELLFRQGNIDPLQAEQIITTQFDPFCFNNAETYSLVGGASQAAATASYAVGGTGLATGVTLSGTLTNPFGVATPFSIVTNNTSGSGIAAQIAAAINASAAGSWQTPAVEGATQPWVVATSAGGASTGTVTLTLSGASFGATFDGALGNSAALSAGSSSSAGITLTRSGANFTGGVDGAGHPTVTTAGSTTRYYVAVPKYQAVTTGAAGSNANYGFAGRDDRNFGWNTVPTAVNVAMTGIANTPVSGATVGFSSDTTWSRIYRYGRNCGYISVGSTASGLSNTAYVTFTMPAASNAVTGAVASAVVGGLFFDVFAVNSSGVVQYQVGFNVPAGGTVQDNGGLGTKNGAGNPSVPALIGALQNGVTLPDRVEVCVGPTSGALIFNSLIAFGPNSYGANLGSTGQFANPYTPSSA